MTAKKSPVEQAIVPVKPNAKSGYTPSEPSPSMRNGQIVEPEDLDEPRYVDGMAEIRANAKKARRITERV
jgi:hypothetical protein